MAAKTNGTVFRVPKTTVFRGASGKCIAIELNSGRIYYFSEDTEPFFEFFQEPHKLETFCENSEVQKGDIAHMHSFCEFLLKKGLLEEAEGTEPAKVTKKIASKKPEFLSESEKTLEEISFACP